MIAVALFALQAASGLSGYLPIEEKLHFVFARDDQHDPEHSDQEKITGTLSTPTEWSPPAFLDIVRECGGKRMRATSTTQHIFVTGQSTPKNLNVARCVKASTSVRFSVHVQVNNQWKENFYDQPFRELWND